MIEVVNNVITWISQPVVALVGGFLLGLFGSFLFWRLQAHITPQIEFDHFVSKGQAAQTPSGIRETPSGVKYRIRFWNTGRRDIIDIEIFARLRIRAEDPYPWSNQAMFTIPLGYQRLPSMKSFKAMRKKRTSREEPPEPRTRIDRLDVHKIDDLLDIQYAAFLSEKFQQHPAIQQELATLGVDVSDFKSNPKLLEHLMQLGEEAYLEIAIFGYDDYSNTRKVFIKTYGIDDIMEKPFKRPPLS